MEERQRLLILGARSFAREVADLAGDIAAYRLEGFVENMERKRCQDAIDGLPVHWVEDVAPLAATHVVVCAFGSTRRAAFVRQAEQMGFRFATLVHPSARVSSRSTVGAGSIVCPGVQVASGTAIGRHVLINRGALIGHNVETGDCITIGPGANIAGFCRLGSGSHIAMGAIVLEKMQIGAGAVVAAGAVVNRDVAPNVLVAGIPAVAVKHGVDGL